MVILSAVVIALLGTIGVVVLTNRSEGLITIGGALVALACAILLVIASTRAVSVAHELGHRVVSVQHDVETARSYAADFQEKIRQFACHVRQGNAPTPREPEVETAEEDTPDLLERELRQAQHVAEVAIAQAATPAAVPSDKRVAVFVTLSRRLQSLVHREIEMLDQLEQNVEDPDLLKGLFFVDHLATCVRRQSESLAVLGGARPRRQWRTPVSLYPVLRSAVAEVEQYARVKVVRPPECTLPGHVTAEIIHLFAELIENATRFSAPETQVLVRAHVVAAGVAIEIEDRGLGLSTEDQQRLNDLLSAPGQIDIEELLTDGRIGLWVVAELAFRHEIVVRLRNNIFGGIDAAVVLPHRLLGDVTETHVTEATSARVRAPAQATMMRSVSGDLDDPVITAPAPAVGDSIPVAAGGEANVSAPPVPAGEGPERAPSVGNTPDGLAASRGRPPLPRRRAQSTPLVSQLLDSSVEQAPDSAAEPGLMATFQEALERGAT